MLLLLLLLLLMLLLLLLRLRLLLLLAGRICHLRGLPGGLPGVSKKRVPSYKATP